MMTARGGATAKEQHNTCPTFKSFATSQEAWRLACLDNGLRIFEEKDSPENDDEHLSPGCKGVGLIFSRPEVLFKLVMDLGKARSQWDLTFDRGSVIERIDENTDIIQVTFRRQCSPQDFCLTRRWSCEPDGSFVVVLSSTEHTKCQPGAGRGLARGKLFGGWIISPFSSSNSSKEPRHEALSACLVTNVVRMQRRGWFEWLQTVGGTPVTKRVVLAQVAGLRELCEHTSDERQLEEQVGGSLAARGVRYKHVETTEDDENFFESCTEASDDEGYAVDLDPTHQHADAEHCEEPGTPRHGAAASSGGEQPPHGEDRSRAVSDMDSEADVARDGDAGSLDKGKWPSEAGYKAENCWCEPDHDYFRVRGVNYLRDRKKVSAGKPFADLVAVDWLVDCQRIDDVCSRPTGTCQRKLLSGSHHAHEPFVFAVNIQVPSSRHYSIVFYYVLKDPLDENSLFGRFVHGDDDFRNSRFKLIPHVALGPWVVQRAVGTKPLIVGRALKVAYHSKPNFLEVDIDIGSSTVANNVVRFVLGYVRSLVVDMCFLIEAQADEDLPERLIGTSRIVHLGMEGAVEPPPVE